MRRLCLAGPLFAVVILAAETAGEGPSPCVLVESEDVRVSDLIPVLPILGRAAPESIVGAAPAPGTRRSFSRDEIGRLLLRFGLPAEQTQPFCVEYKTQAISHHQIRDALLEAWRSGRDRLGAPGPPEIELVDWSRQPVPSGKLEFPVSLLAAARPHPRDGLVFCRGALRYGQGRSVPVWARARIGDTGPAVLAQVTLPAGRPIEAAQLRVESVRQYAFAPAGVDAVEAAAGATPRRTIRAGEVVLGSLLVTPPLVRPGEKVALLVKRGQASVRFEAEALTGGRRGERILVRSPINRSRLNAVVEGQGRAAVIPGG